MGRGNSAPDWARDHASQAGLPLYAPPANQANVPPRHLDPYRPEPTYRGSGGFLPRPNVPVGSIPSRGMGTRYDPSFAQSRYPTMSAPPAPTPPMGMGIGEAYRTMGAPSGGTGSGIPAEILDGSRGRSLQADMLADMQAERRRYESMRTGYASPFTRFSNFRPARSMVRNPFYFPIPRFASGGRVESPVMQPVQSPYPSKPYESMADVLAEKGRYGDSMMMHVNPLEVAALDQMVPGGLPRNPETGQPEAFFFLLPALGSLLTAGGGALAAGATSLLGTGALGSAVGGALSAIPTLAGSALTGVGSALGSALGGTALGSAATTVPQALVSALPSSAASAIPASLGGTGSALGSIGSTFGSVGSNLAAGNFGQAISGLGQGLGQVAGIPFEAAGSLLGTHSGSGGLGSFLPGAESAATTGGGPPGTDPGISDVVTKTGEMSQNVSSPADLARDVIAEGSNPFPSGEMSQNVGQQIADMGSQVAEETARNVPVDPGPTTGDGGGLFADADLGDYIGMGLLGATAIDYLFPPDEDDPFAGESSYEGPSSFSTRTYTGARGGGRSGAPSFYSGYSPRVG